MTVVLTTLEALERGLLAIGYDQRQLGRVGMKKNISRFRANYVSHPRVYADLFERLQNAEEPEQILATVRTGTSQFLKQPRQRSL